MSTIYIFHFIWSYGTNVVKINLFCERNSFQVASLVHFCVFNELCQVNATGKDKHKTHPKKYVNINGKVSKHKWQSMFRYLGIYV